MKRKLSLVFIFLLTIGARAQIELSEVVVVADRLATVAATEDLRLDSLPVQRVSAPDIFSLLEMKAGIYLRSFGPGLATTLTYRGFSGSQTAVYWNGIPLASPALGLTDIGTLPLLSGDEVYFDEGSGSVLYGSAYMGGGLHIRSDWKASQPWSIENTSYYNSINLLTNQSSLTWNRSKHRHRLNFVVRNGDQNYKYRDLYGNERERLGADISSYNLQYIGSGHQANNTFKWGVWLLDIDRGLPRSVSESYTPGARQFDKGLRAFAEWNHHYVDGFLQLRSATTYEDQQYVSEITADTNLAYAQYSTLTYSKKFLKKWNFTAVAEHTWQEVHGSGKSTGHTHRLGASLVVSGNLSENWRLRFGIREEHQNQWTPLIPNASIVWKSRWGYSSQLSYRHHFRFPTLNDLYWNPGGNPSLLPETGSTASWDHEWRSRKLWRGASIKTNGAAYYARTENYIQWLPAGMYFSPGNIKEVEHYGAEASLAIEQTLPRSLNWDASVSYAYTKVQTLSSLNPGDPSIGNQLIYTPVHSVSFRTGGEWKSFKIWTLCRLRGQVFTAADNHEGSEIPGFAVWDAGVSYQNRWGNTDAQLRFVLTNIGDIVYEQQRYYPMPGLNYSVQLTLKIYSNEKHFPE